MRFAFIALTFLGIIIGSCLALILKCLLDFQHIDHVAFTWLVIVTVILLAVGIVADYIYSKNL